MLNSRCGWAELDFMVIEFGGGATMLETDGVCFSRQNKGGSQSAQRKIRGIVQANKAVVWFIVSMS